MKGGANPRDIKARLAREIVSLYHGVKQAAGAETAFNSAFREGKPNEFLEVFVSDAVTVGDALVTKKVVESKSDLRRLIAEGAVTNIDTGAKMGEEFLKNAPPGKYRLGKHRFVRIHGTDTE
jgi:tyrosyl-tRNA synthetase